MNAQQVSIYENSRVTEVEEIEDRVHLKTTGGNVAARYAIHATHIPKGIMPVQMTMSMYREYGIAWEVEAGKFPEGIFWGYHESEDKYSTRTYHHEGKHYLSLVGKPHRVGQNDSNKASIEELKSFGEKHFGLKKPRFVWGGQNYKSVDLLPFIGRVKGNSPVFMATGFATDGLVYGTLAALVIADEITGKENKYKELYKVDRIRPKAGAIEFIEEGVNTAKQYAKDILGLSYEKELNSLPKGEGKVVKIDGEKVAVYHSPEGKLIKVSGECTHMKCVVNWNNAEKTWDCPCHASRFKPDGTVIEGPAFNPLPPISTEF